MKFISKTGIVIHRKICWLLLFSVFSLAVVSWLIYVSKRNIDRTNLRINQTYEIIDRFRQMSATVSESGSTCYRYLASGDQEAASQLNGFHETLEQDLQSLKRLAIENGDQVKNLDLLNKNIIDKRSFEEILVKSSFPFSGNTQHREEGYREARIDSVLKELLDKMIQQERKLLENRKRLNEIANNRTAMGLVIGRTAGFLFVVIILIQLNRDITRRNETQEKLIIAIREAQSAKQMQEQFLANMSHEIRTPMNGIKGMTDLLLGTSLSDKQHELIEIIKRSVNNLLVILNDILDFSKIKAGKLNIEKIDFNVQDILNGIRSVFDHPLRKKGLILQLETDPDIPNRLKGDPHRLNQVFINLLGNAIKFTDNGHIRIQAILKSRTEDKVVLSFTVEDSGIGIPADSLPYIFDSFSQAGRGISPKYGGTGLGLAICKQLIQLQDGDITATSTPGKGSVFIFTLPYEYDDQKDPELPIAGNPKNYTDLLSGKNILVAEDNEINQKLIDFVLKKAGGTVELVSNGAEAIKYLKNNDRAVDLIIMDLQMPEMDGYAATRYIRNELKLHTPIIAMTATAMKGEQWLCLESGMNEYMTKPFEFGDLYEKISKLLN